MKQLLLFLILPFFDAVALNEQPNPKISCVKLFLLMTPEHWKFVERSAEYAGLSPEKLVGQNPAYLSLLKTVGFNATHPTSSQIDPHKIVFPSIFLSEITKRVVA
jgi:hypothetical protein